MAKAIYHKHQRVYVYPVGTWALIEQVKPQWVKDVEEPVRVFYDCGLGRDFTADELATEQVESLDAGHWRVLRAKNKWQSSEECVHHPFPGTFPVVVTEEMDWGGWRVPAAEYDRDPNRIEAQARLLANAPGLLELAEQLVSLAREDGDLPPALDALSRKASDIVKSVTTSPSDNSKSSSRHAA